MSPTPWIVIFTGICFAGLTAVALQAFAAGANAYSGTYSSKTARQFEDIFLFIPPRRIAEIGWICAALTAILVAGGKSQRVVLAPVDGKRLSGSAAAALPSQPKGVVQLTAPDGKTVQAKFD